MTIYSPVGGEVLNTSIKFHPKTTFIMTSLSNKSSTLLKIREDLKKELIKYGYQEKDASDIITGGDFLDKIWKIILGVPVGIVIITADMSSSTLSNIFYELGIMDSLGKETIIIKSEEVNIPSDFKRTEYIKYDVDFGENLKKFFDNIFEQHEYYITMSEVLEKNPMLSIDYIKRAFLISGKQDLKDKAIEIYNNNKNIFNSNYKYNIINLIK